MKYDEVRARDLTYRLRSLDMNRAAKTVEGMIEEIKRLREALGQILDDQHCPCSPQNMCLSCKISYKALNTK